MNSITSLFRKPQADQSVETKLAIAAQALKAALDQADAEDWGSHMRGLISEALSATQAAQRELL